MVSNFVFWIIELLILFLASGQASWITGQIIKVDGAHGGCGFFDN